MRYKRRWRQKSNFERHYTGVLYQPLNTDGPVHDSKVGRIWLRIFPEGNGPIYRFRIDPKFVYPDGYVSNYFPDDSVGELIRAGRKARRVLKKLHRFQQRPTLVGYVLYSIGWRF